MTKKQTERKAEKYLKHVQSGKPDIDEVFHLLTKLYEKQKYYLGVDSEMELFIQRYRGEIL